MGNKKDRNRDFSISFRFFDERFDQIFGLTKENYKVGLKELDRLLKAKIGKDLREILKEK